MSKKTKKTCPNCGQEYDGVPAISRKDNETEICPVCGMKEALAAAGKSVKKHDEKTKLVEALELVNQRISDERTRLEAITLVKDSNELDPVLVEGETEAGYWVQTWVGEADLQWIAETLLKYDYPIYKVLGEDFPDAMWEELGRHFGLKTVTSVDL